MSKRKHPCADRSSESNLSYFDIEHSNFLELVREFKTGKVSGDCSDLSSNNDVSSDESVMSDGNGEEELQSLSSEDCEQNESSSDSSDLFLNERTESVKDSLKRDLASLVVKRRFNQGQTKALLDILNKHDVTDVKTHGKLMNIPKEKVTARKVVNGSIYYRGIRRALIERKHLLKNLKHVELDIGIDGATFFDSSRLTLWPVIGSVSNLRDIRPFLIGNFSTKIYSIFSFLHCKPKRPAICISM